MLVVRAPRANMHGYRSRVDLRHTQLIAEILARVTARDVACSIDAGAFCVIRARQLRVRARTIKAAKNQCAPGNMRGLLRGQSG